MVAVAGGVGVGSATGAHALHPKTMPIMTKMASRGLDEEEVGIIGIPYNFSDLMYGRLLTASVCFSILSTGKIAVVSFAGIMLQKPGAQKTAPRKSRGCTILYSLFSMLHP
jgi:hypothetical protein